MNLVLILIILIVSSSLLGFNKREYLDKMMFIPYEIKHSNQYYRFISHIFIHSDWAHLLFNTISFYYLGSYLYNSLIINYNLNTATFHFLIIFFVGGILASMYSYFKNKDNQLYRALGASGAVSAIIFAMIIWEPQMELMIMFLPIPIPAYIFGPLYLAFEYYAYKKGQSGIAHDAHIGGAIFGVIYILIINFDKGKEFLNHIF